MGSGTTRPKKHNVAVKRRKGASDQTGGGGGGAGNAPMIDQCRSWNAELASVNHALATSAPEGVPLGQDTDGASVAVIYQGQVLGKLGPSDSGKLLDCQAAGNSYVILWKGDGTVFIQKE